MKKFVLILFLVFVGFSIAFGLSIVKPQVGYEVVLIDRPLFFGKGGIQPEPVKTKTKITWKTTEQIHVKMKQYFSNVYIDQILSKEGVPIDINFTFGYTITDSVAMVSKFKENCSENWFKEYFKPIVMEPFFSDVISKYSLEELKIAKESTSRFGTVKEIRDKLESFILRNGLPIKLTSFYFNDIRFPPKIEEELVEILLQQTKLVTEQKRQKVEEQRLETERKRAEADIAYRNKMGMSNKDFALIRQINVMQELCRFNKNCTFLIGNYDTFPIKHPNKD